MDEYKALELLLKITIKNLGFTPRTPADFNMASIIIRRKIEATISSSTLKRLWGYIGYGSKPSPNTLNRLARYNDYIDWNSFVKNAGRNCDGDTSVYLTESVVTAESLSPGDVLIVEWFKDKMCEMEFLGDYRFKVTLTQNIKLRVNDVLTLHSVTVGLPLSVSMINRGNKVIAGYIGAKSNGVLYIKIQRSNKKKK